MSPSLHQLSYPNSLASEANRQGIHKSISSLYQLSYPNPITALLSQQTKRIHKPITVPPELSQPYHWLLKPTNLGFTCPSLYHLSYPNPIIGF